MAPQQSAKFITPFWGIICAEILTAPIRSLEILRMVMIDVVINSLDCRVTRHPADMHCPSCDDAFVSSYELLPVHNISIMRKQYWTASLGSSGACNFVEICTKTTGIKHKNCMQSKLYKLLLQKNKC